MAEPNLKGVVYADTPHNPLSQPYWTRAYADPSQYDAATLAGITTAIHALARVLGNNEALRDIQANSEPDDSGDLGDYPLDSPVTEGLFAALYFLSEQAQRLSQVPEPPQCHPSDVPY